MASSLLEFIGANIALSVSIVVQIGMYGFACVLYLKLEDPEQRRHKPWMILAFVIVLISCISILWGMK